MSKKKKKKINPLLSAAAQLIETARYIGTIVDSLYIPQVKAVVAYAPRWQLHLTSVIIWNNDTLGKSG